MHRTLGDVSPALSRMPRSAATALAAPALPTRRSSKSSSRSSNYSRNPRPVLLHLRGRQRFFVSWLRAFLLLAGFSLLTPHRSWSLRSAFWPCWPQHCSGGSEHRRLTPPSSGRSKGRFAPFGPPLMSNVRSRQIHWVCALRLVRREGHRLALGRSQTQFQQSAGTSRSRATHITPARARTVTWAARPLAVG